MILPNNIVLRPRFKYTIPHPSETIINWFEKEKHQQKTIIVNCLEPHIFLKFPKAKQHAWSPQLHLELEPTNENETVVSGVFGPNPAVWTMFMFFHFVVAGFFIAFGVWAYSNSLLGAAFSIQLFLCLLMVIFWALLYVFGRLGKSKGTPEMQILHEFVIKTLNC